MRHLFDSFAPTYDATMLQQLGYARQPFESPIRWHFRSHHKLVVLVGDRSDRQIVTGGGRDDAAFRAAAADLEQMLTAAGFEVTKRFGDYNGAGWSEDSPRTILFASRR